MSKTASASKPVNQVESVPASAGNVLGIIVELTARLKSAGWADAKRTAADIVSALLQVSRAWPALNPDATIADAIVGRARAAAERLIGGAPFAYAVGSAQFRHLHLIVDERVLIPRPETEVLVDEVMAAMRSRFGSAEPWGTAIDIGTGSGAIALSLAAEGKFDRVIATDVSRDAIEVAQGNLLKSAALLHCAVEFRRGSLVAPVRDVRATALVSNPPYIAFSEIDSLPASVRDWEPPAALFSGNDGMWAIGQIIIQGAGILVSGGILALEVDERRASVAAELMMANGGYEEIGVRLDLAGRERFVLASKI
jgi:release factor glutamine methyltransferase